MAKNAKRFLDEIEGNVDAWYLGQMDYGAFSARQRATWDAIRRAGRDVEEAVLRALRDRMPPARLAPEGRA